MSLSIPPGSSATATGLSGMRAAQRNLDTSAHNVANLQTPGFRRQAVEQTAQPNHTAEAGVRLMSIAPVSAGRRFPMSLTSMP